MKINIICDCLHLDKHKRELAERPIYLSTDPHRGNVYLNLEGLAQDLGCDIDSLSRDFCEIASYIYVADKALPRGEFGHWGRSLSFLVPVRNPSKWNAVKRILTNTLSTLSGDNLHFQFVQRIHKDNRQDT